MWIWQVARAATAAPMYFAELPYKMGSDDPTKKYFYSDGCFGSTNNPTSLGVKELEAMHGRTGVGVIVSMSTARVDTDPGKKSIFHRIKEGFHTATDPNTVADMVNGQEKLYQTGIELELDHFLQEEKKTLETISQHFFKWVALRKNQTMIEACEHELVARRIMRSKDGDKWYRFANGASHFTYRHEDCSTSYTTREDFCEHWRTIHEAREDAHSHEEPEFSKWIYPPKERLQ